MPNYTNGKIYRIISYNTMRQYIGGTTQQLSKRLSEHKRHKTQYDNKTRKSVCRSYEILTDGNYKIELIS